MVEHYKQFIGQYVDQAPSPLSNWLHGKILDITENGISLEFEVRKEMTNPVNLLHGGMMAAIIDDVIGMTLFVTGVKSFYASINLHIDFVSNVRCGEKIVAQSQLIRKGKRVILASCSLFGPNQNLLAKATSNLIMTEGSDYTHTL
ncbi:MAG: PaaI family thioesterase [Flavobacteriales bacterium]|nr:PaaI family thioesterase [Flavobacteriales bacterium]MCZ2443617.1 PaaI family thioesterase [Flavobacteriales bacterium]